MKLKIKELLFSEGVATNSLYLAVVSLATTLIGIIIVKILSVKLSLQDYGTYSQALLLTNTMSSFTALGLSTATNYFYNSTNTVIEKKSYVSTIVYTQLLIGFISGVILICLRFRVASIMSNPALSIIIYIIAFTPLMINLIGIYQVLFVSIGKAKNIAIRNLSVSLVKLCAVIFVCYKNNNVSIILFVILIMDFIQIVYFHMIYIKSGESIQLRCYNIQLLKSIFGFSIPFAIYALAGSFAADIDKYVISIFCDIDTVAIYSNAAKRLPFAILTDSFVTILVPIITRLIGEKKYVEAKEVFRLYLKLGCISTFIIGFGALILSKSLMCFLYDEKYLSGLPVFMIYIIVEMVRFANVTILLTASGKTMVLMLNSVLMLILNAVFDVITYRLFGTIGPAVTTLFLSLSSIAVLLHFGAKEIKCGIRDLFDLKQVIIVLFEIICISFPINYLQNYIRIYSHNNTFSFVFTFLVYCLVLGLLNFKQIFSVINELNEYK